MNSTHIDMIIRLKNGYMAEKKSVTAMYSRLNENILGILKKRGYVDTYEVLEDGNKKSLNIVLRYEGSQPAVRGVKLFSRPGRRQYIKTEKVRPVQGGLGLSLVSTSKGLMTDADARKNGVGGEVIVSIW